MSNKINQLTLESWERSARLTRLGGYRNEQIYVERILQLIALVKKQREALLSFQKCGATLGCRECDTKLIETLALSVEDLEE